MKKSINFGFAVPLFFLLMLVFLLWYQLGDDPRILPSALLGKTVPEFQQETLAHTKIDAKVFKGQVTVLNVWASWCLSCHIEHPFLMDIANDKNINVVGLNYKDSRSAANHWLQNYGDPYRQCIYDPEGQLGMQLGVYGTPETFLIDKNGKVRYKYVGQLDAEIWAKHFVPRLKNLTRT